GRRNSAAAPGHAATGAAGTDATGDTSSGKGKGATISTLTRTTTATGRDKGATISSAASGGKSHAGQPPGRSLARSGPSPVAAGARRGWAWKYAVGDRMGGSPEGGILPPIAQDVA